MTSNGPREQTGEIQVRWEKTAVPLQRTSDGIEFGGYTRTIVHVERPCQPYVAYTARWHPSGAGTTDMPLPANPSS